MLSSFVRTEPQQQLSPQLQLAGINSDANFYEYNGYNQLTKAVVGDKTATYSYDGNGLRTSKMVNGVETNHIWDGGNIVADVGANTTKYVRGLGIIFSNTNNSKIFYHHNAHGDVTNLTNATGGAVKSYNYDAFGVEKDPTTTDTNPFRYCGEYLDLSSGLYYLRARYYNLGIGRFMTEDPIRSGMNWYIYANNNPILYVDPSGLISVIFVASGMEEQADARKDYYTDIYKTDSYKIVINSAEHFVEKWNEWFNLMAEQGQTVDAIEIISHGGISGDVGKDANGTAFSTSYAMFGGNLYARDTGSLGSRDRSVESLVSTTAKELNINSCNSATKETYNLVFGFMGKVTANKYTGFDGGARWDAKAKNAGSTVRGDHVRGGGDWTLAQSTPWDPWRLVRENQGTWLRYVDKKSDGTPARDRIGRRPF